MAKHRLTNLVFDEVSSVDRGAGEGVRVVLAKRDALTPIAKTENVEQATAALNAAVAAIIANEAVTDKAAKVSKSVAEFTAHIAGLAQSTTENDPMPMTPAETAALEKQIADSVTKAVTAVTSKFEGEIAKRDDEIAFLKLSPEQKEFCKAMSPEDKKKFMDKTDPDKDKEMEEAKKAAVSKIDPAIQKRLDQAEQNEKVLKALVEKDEIATFAKRATGLGLAEADGEILRKAYGGDAAAQIELDKRLKALTEQVKVGKVFDEFGNGGPGKGDKSAYDEICEKAEELRKADAKLTPAQARVAVMENPANAELMKRHKAEEIQKRARAA